MILLRCQIFDASLRPRFFTEHSPCPRSSNVLGCLAENGRFCLAAARF
jgi:hypothetical protein